MKNFKLFYFKTLQGRLIGLLLLPIFLALFSGGIISFLFTRNVLLDQWNESAVLKLQRAAHYIQMRLLKPIELSEILFKIFSGKNNDRSFDTIIKQLKGLEGVVDANFIRISNKETDAIQDDSVMRYGSMMPAGRMMNRKDNGMKQFHHSRLLKISSPVFDADRGHKTVTLFFNILTTGDEEIGKLEIKMSFDYLLKDIIKLGWWQSDMACLVDQSLKYMAHTNMSMQGRYSLGGGKDPLEMAIIDEMKIKPSGTVKSSGHPPKMIAGFYKLDQIPWTIILFAKGNKVLTRITAYRNGFVLGSFILMMIILLLIRNHVGKTADKIKTLSKNAQKVAKGEYGPPVSADSRDEIGQLVNSYNSMVKGLKERDFIRDSFGRYVDPEFAKFLLKHPDAGKLGGQRREVVIMMSDIRGFTALSETFSPEIIIRVLNQYFSHMITIIQQYNGIIVDFFGDAILVFFEPFSDPIEDTIHHGLQCSKDMQARMSEFNREMKDENLPQLHMGIGIHAGQVIVGNIGSATRSKYGIVGSAVNITSRIQATAGKQEIVISDTAYQYIKNEISVEKTFDAVLKGVDVPMKLHIIKEVID